MSKQEATRLADALTKPSDWLPYYGAPWHPQAHVVDEAAALLRQWPDGEPVAVRCPDCIGSQQPGWRRGMRCVTCDGTATVAAPPDSAARIAELEANIIRANAAMQEVERVVTHLIAKEAALRAALKVAGEALKDVLEEAKWSTDSEWEKDRAAKALQQIKEAQR